MPTANPTTDTSETVTISKEAVKHLSLYKLSCDKTKLDFEDTKNALSACMLNPPPPKFWQEPEFIIGVGVGGVVAGFLIKSLVDSMTRR